MRNVINDNGMPQHFEAFHFKEYYEYIGQIGFLQPTRIRLFLHQQNSMVDEEPSLSRMLFLIGLAKAYSLEGNLIRAEKTFQKAFTLSHELKNLTIEADSEDPFAYLNFEYALFLKITEADEKADYYLLKAEILAKTVRFKKMIEFQHLLNEQDISGSDYLSKADDLLAFFNKNDMPLLVCSVLHRLGNYQVRQGDFKNGLANQKRALADAKRHGFQYLKWNILNTIGLAYYRKGDNDKAIKHFHKILSEVENPHFKCLILKNLAIRYYINTDFKMTLKLLTEALEIGRQNGITSEIPATYYLIARTKYELTGDRGAAYPFYRQAYEEIMAQTELGIPIAKSRKSIIKDFLGFMIEAVPDGVTEKLSEDLFQFAVGKPWERIKDLFHYNLFIYHYLRTGPGDQTFEQLKILPSTFYSLRDRLKKRGLHFPDFRRTDVTFPEDLYIESLQSYVRIHRHETWTDINERFEREMYSYLYRIYGYNKKTLANKLSLAYSGVLNKTKHLTDTRPYDHPQG